MQAGSKIFSQNSQYNINPPTEEQRVEDWISLFIQKLKDGRDGEFDVNKAEDINYWDTWKINFVVENFPADKIHYYVALQSRIAEIIPIEEFRPTILLRVRGKAVQNKEADSLLIGGVGPLSDAEIASSVISHSSDEDREKLSFDLFSSPPNRGINLSKIVRLGKYLGDLTRVIELSVAKKVFMLSNTYHVHIPMIQSFIDYFNTSGMEIVDMVLEIGRSIKDDIDRNPDTTDNNVLILGTIEAAKKRLYPTILEGFDIKFTNVTSNEDLKAYEKKAKSGHKVEQTKQHKLQEIIDHVKSGRVNQKVYGENTVGDELVSFVFEHIKSSKSNYLILGCTELPLGLHAKKEGTDKTYLEILTAKVEEAGIKMPKILDSEVEFSKIIRRENAHKEVVAPEVIEARKTMHYHKLQADIANGKCDDILKGFLDTISSIASEVAKSNDLTTQEKNKVASHVNRLFSDIKEVNSKNFSKDMEACEDVLIEAAGKTSQMKGASGILSKILGVLKGMFAAITGKYGMGYEGEFKPKDEVVLEVMLKRMSEIKKQELSKPLPDIGSNNVKALEGSSRDVDEIKR